MPVHVRYRMEKKHNVSKQSVDFEHHSSLQGIGFLLKHYAGGLTLSVVWLQPGLSSGRTPLWLD